MEELVDLMVKDESPSETSDKIKEILFAKTAERVEGLRPNAALSLFDNAETNESEVEEE
jgi:hypothetical protein